MPADNVTGTLRLTTDRAGTVTEISQFLADLEGAYLQLYRFQYLWPVTWPPKRRRMMLELFDVGFSYPLLGLPAAEALTPETLLPEDRLVISRVSIESPGFWEFIASLNLSNKSVNT